MKKLNRGLGLVGVTVCAGLAIGGIALAGSSSQPGEDPERPEGPVTSIINSDVREEVVSLDAPLVAAVAAALPGSPDIHKAVHRWEVDMEDPRDINTGLDYFDLSAVVNGGGYQVYVYRFFDPAEMEAFELPSTRLEGGTSWVGSDGQTGDDVYYQADNGVALYISLIGDDAAATTADDLGSIAEQMATDPAIQEAVAR